MDALYQAALDGRITWFEGLRAEDFTSLQFVKAQQDNLQFTICDFDFI